MAHFRLFNAAISCRTFVGYHLSDQEVAKISDDLFCMTAAMDLVNMPLTVFIPYTRVCKGKRAATAVRNAFIRAAAASRRHMATGGKPTCIVDRWISIMMESSEYQTQVAAGNKDLQKPAIILREFSDYEIAQVLFTFSPRKMRPAARQHGCSRLWLSAPKSSIASERKHSIYATESVMPPSHSMILHQWPTRTP